MAKITGISQTSEGYEYTCKRASYFDVFDKLIYAGDAENSNTVATRAPGDPLDGNTLWNHNINFQEGAVEVNSRNQGIARFAFYRNQDDYRATLNLQTRNEETAELNYMSPLISRSFEIIRPIPLGTFRIPHPLLSFIFIRPTFELSLNLDSKTGVKTKYEYRRVDEYQLVWDNPGVSMIHTTPINTRAVNTTLDATEYEVSLYFQPRILLGFNGTRTGVGISGDFGLKLFNDEIPDNFQTMNAEEAYLELEDKGVHLNDMSSGSWFAQANLFGLNPDNDHRVTRNFAYRETPVATYHYLPRFNNAGLEYNKGNISVEYNVFRDTWNPVNVGIGVFDKDGNMYDHYLEETAYQHENMDMRCNWI